GRRLEGDDRAAAVDHDGMSVPRDAGDLPRAAELAPRLPGRVHLERPDGGEEARASRYGSAVLDAVAEEEHVASRVARRERGRPEDEVARVPDRGRDRDPVVLQRLSDLRVGPRDEVAVDEHRGLDRERAAVDLDQTLLVHDRAGVAVGEADGRPVRLLARE